MTSLRPYTPYGVEPGEELVSDRDKTRREEQKRADKRERERLRGERVNFSFPEVATAEQANALFDLVQVQSDQIEHLKARIDNLYSETAELWVAAKHNKAIARDADASFQKLQRDFDRFVGLSILVVTFLAVTTSLYFALR